VLAILIILRASVLLYFLIRREDIYDLGLERRSKAFWIIVSGFHFQVTQIRPPQPVSDMQLSVSVQVRCRTARDAMVWRMPTAARIGLAKNMSVLTVA